MKTDQQQQQRHLSLNSKEEGRKPSTRCLSCWFQLNLKQSCSFSLSSRKCCYCYCIDWSVVNFQITSISCVSNQDTSIQLENRQKSVTICMTEMGMMNLNVFVAIVCMCVFESAMVIVLWERITSKFTVLHEIKHTIESKSKNRCPWKCDWEQNGNGGEWETKSRRATKTKMNYINRTIMSKPCWFSTYRLTIIIYYIGSGG